MDLNKDQELCNQSITYVSPNILNRLWRIVYWYSFWATWLIVPFIQGYVESGHFERIRRIKDSIWDNLVFYGEASIMLLFMVLYLMIGTAINTKYEMIVLSNSYIEGKYLHSLWLLETPGVSFW